MKSYDYDLHIADYERKLQEAERQHLWLAAQPKRSSVRDRIYMWFGERLIVIGTAMKRRAYVACRAGMV